MLLVCCRADVGVGQSVMYRPWCHAGGVVGIGDARNVAIHALPGLIEIYKENLVLNMNHSFRSVDSLGLSRLSCDGCHVT